MIYLLVTQTLTLLALAYVVRANQGTLRDVLTQSAADRKDHRAELAEVLQRLQAPEAAIVAHEVARDATPPEPIMPLTDRESAELADPTLAIDTVIAEMEHRENQLHDLLTPAP